MCYIFVTNLKWSVGGLYLSVILFKVFEKTARIKTISDLKAFAYSNSFCAICNEKDAFVNRYIEIGNINRQMHKLVYSRDYFVSRAIFPSFLTSGQSGEGGVLYVPPPALWIIVQDTSKTSPLRSSTFPVFLLYIPVIK